MERRETKRRVVDASCVLKERSRADGRVEIGGGIAKQRSLTDRGVAKAPRIRIQGTMAIGRVLVAGVAKEGSIAGRCIAARGRVLTECTMPDRCVLSAGSVQVKRLKT